MARRAHIQAMATTMFHIVFSDAESYQAAQDIGSAMRRLLIEQTMKACLLAAQDLADLYEECNGASVSDIMEDVIGAQRALGRRETVDNDFVGYMLAELAIGSGVKGRPYRELVAMMPTTLVVPTFTIKFERGELVWEGECAAGKVRHRRERRRAGRSTQPEANPATRRC